MHIKRGEVSQGIRKGKLSLALQLPNLVAGQDGVGDLLDVQRAKRFIRQKAVLGSAVTEARLRGLTGAKMQLTAAGTDRLAEQLINMDFADWEEFQCRILPFFSFPVLPLYHLFCYGSG